MKLWVVSLVLASLLVLAQAPSAAAFHGSPYQADGTAVFVANGTVYDASVFWLGSGALGTGNYRVELYEQGTGVPFHKLTFVGQETFPNVYFIEKDGCPWVEIAEYDGISVVGGPAVFHIWGWQENNLCTGNAFMRYWGDYLTVYQLDLTVWTAL